TMVYASGAGGEVDGEFQAGTRYPREADHSAGRRGRAFQHAAQPLELRAHTARHEAAQQRALVEVEAGLPDVRARPAHVHEIPSCGTFGEARDAQRGLEVLVRVDLLRDGHEEAAGGRVRGPDRHVVEARHVLDPELLLQPV